MPFILVTVDRGRKWSYLRVKFQTKRLFENSKRILFRARMPLIGVSSVFHSFSHTKRLILLDLRFLITRHREQKNSCLLMIYRKLSLFQLLKGIPRRLIGKPDRKTSVSNPTCFISPVSFPKIVSRNTYFETSIGIEK